MRCGDMSVLGIDTEAEEPEERLEPIGALQLRPILVLAALTKSALPVIP